MLGVSSTTQPGQFCLWGVAAWKEGGGGGGGGGGGPVPISEMKLTGVQTDYWM